MENRFRQRCIRIRCFDLVRELGCYSVKRGCETANCGLCTVWLDGSPYCHVPLWLSSGWTSCNLLWRDFRRRQRNLAFLAAEGGEQCGFCSPGFIMNVLAMERELKDPTEDEIRVFSRNLCRCSDICPSFVQLKVSGCKVKGQGLMAYSQKRPAEAKSCV